MREHRIYLDGELVNVCYNEYTLLWNKVYYTEQYGAARVEIKTLAEVTDDEEKSSWLQSL